MNHKIQAIITKAANDTDGRVFTSEERRRVILRAVLEVIGEAGVEGALEDMLDLWKRQCHPRNIEFDSQVKASRAALRTLRTLKELHQSSPVRPEDSNVTTN